MDLYYWDTLSKKSSLQGGSEKIIQVSEKNDSLSKKIIPVSDKKISISENKYNKMKSFIKAAKGAIIYYRDIAQNYYNSYNIIFLNYMYLLKLLRDQKNNLLEKQSQYEKLGKDFVNGKEKISMLETMIDNLEKIVNKTTKLDLEIKNKINEREFNLKADAKLTPNKYTNMLDAKIMLGGQYLKGGVMDFDTFESYINTDLQDLELKANEINADNEFIENKIRTLHQRVKTMIVDTEDLMNIRLSIEWLVNQLENTSETPTSTTKGNIPEPQKQDYQELYNKLKTTIDKIKGIQKSPKIEAYLRELEGITSYIDNFIKSSKDTLKGMPDEKREEMLKVLKDFYNIKQDFLQDEQTNQFNNSPRNTGLSKKYLKKNNGKKDRYYIGTNNILDGGGEFINNYNKINQEINEKLNKSFLDTDNVVVFLKSNNDKLLTIVDFFDGAKNEPDKFRNDKQDKLYQLFIMVKELNEIFKTFKTFYETFTNFLQRGHF